MLHVAVEAAFDDLLTRWRAHWHRQRHPVSVEDLARSRYLLDQARNRMHQLRIAAYPEGDELQGIVESVWCEQLELVVHLRWADRHPTRPGNFACPCGHLVPVDWERCSGSADP